MKIQSLGHKQVSLGTTSIAQAGIGATPSASYFSNVGGASNFNLARVANDLTVLRNLNLTSSTGDMQVPTAGMDIHRNSGEANGKGVLSQHFPGSLSPLF